MKYSEEHVKELPVSYRKNARLHFLKDTLPLVWIQCQVPKALFEKL